MYEETMDYVCVFYCREDSKSKIRNWADQDAHDVTRCMPHFLPATPDSLSMD